MHSSTVTGAAAILLALAPSAWAVGSAKVINNCDFDVYYASVSQGVSAEPALIQGSYSEKYSLHNNGVSIKLALEPNLGGEVSQFEFTWYDGNTAYDLSNIDGYPFAEWGITIEPSVSADSDYPTCVPVDCPAGEVPCDAAYNLPDDVRTLVCADTTDLVLTICPNGSGSSSSSSPSYTSSTSASASTPTSTSEPTSTSTSASASTPTSTPTSTSSTDSSDSSDSSSSSDSFPQRFNRWGGGNRAFAHVHNRIHPRSFKVDA